MEPPKELSLLHLSDTHGMHRTIEQQFPLPPADILFHTGDFTNHGTLEEFMDFNHWLGELRSRYRHIVVVYGNHEYRFTKCLKPTDEHVRRSLEPGYFKELLNNATVLEHEEVEILGLRIYGSPWCPWYKSESPGDAMASGTLALEAFGLWQAGGGVGHHRFSEIPVGVDILLTHCPPYGILDEMEGAKVNWGGSMTLREEILRAKPRVHLFGHIHEQRGLWRRRADGSGFEGGVEYRRRMGEPWGTWPPPPADYPCEIISCGAMANHPKLEGRESRIAGPAQLLVARKATGCPWSFDLPASTVRILHLSDTHCMHRSIEAEFPLPPADILLHTGDFTSTGSPSEFSDFNAWLGELKPRYKHIIVIAGNHEWMFLNWTDPNHPGMSACVQPGYVQRQLSNAVVLEHESIEVMGLRIFGCSWCPWYNAGQPGDVSPREPARQRTLALWRASGGAGSHRFGEIPPGIDILLTHCAPFGVFDQVEGSRAHWGGSKALKEEILRAKPRVHLFGHIHEQRGLWCRRADGSGFDGGVRYRRRMGEPWGTWPPPPADHPCQIISCGAMANHAGLEGGGHRIAGPAHLLLASRSHTGGPWCFEALTP